MSEFPGLSAPARRALARAGFATLGDLTKARAAEVARLHGMGPNGVGRLRQLLAAQGLAFAAE